MGFWASGNGVTMQEATGAAVGGVIGLLLGAVVGLLLGAVAKLLMPGPRIGKKKAPDTVGEP